MNELAAIEALYSELTSGLDLALEKARMAADPIGVVRIGRKRQINDSAYFILAWGQLEAEINRKAEAAVRMRRASIRWEERRAWDAHDPDNMRAKFEDRAALVLDRFNANSDAYRRTIRYWLAQCHRSWRQPRDRHRCRLDHPRSIPDRRRDHAID